MQWWWKMSNKLYIPETLAEYDDLWDWIQSVKVRSLSEWEEVMRWYSLNDLFFMINYVGSDGKKIHSQYGTRLLFHDVYLELAKKTQRQIENYISSFDGSARRFSKSTFRTKWGSIYMALNNPDISIGIFSVERQLAKKHLNTIKEELETNKLLKILHSDKIWDDPREAAKQGQCIWSADEGLRLKRTIVRPNQTFEHGAFYGKTPTGSGYDVIHFDDCEDDSVVATQDSINKLHESYAAAVALATPTVTPKQLIFTTNTFYHPEGIAKKKYDEYKKQGPEYYSVYPGEDLSRPGDGPLGGTPQYPFTKELLDFWYSESGDRTKYAIQYCCDFTAGEDRTMKEEHLGWFEEDPLKLMREMNTYVCIDASRGIYDPMGIWVWGLGKDKKHYWLDGLRKKLDPASPRFHDEVFNIVSKASNISQRCVEVRVEQLPNQTWADLIASELRKRGCYITVVACKGKIANRGRFNSAKLEREWERWAPALQRGEIMFPKPSSRGGKGILTQDENEKPFDLVDYFLEYEFRMFPRSKHDDLLDAGALLWEPDVTPLLYPSFIHKRRATAWELATKRPGWMSAGG